VVDVGVAHDRIFDPRRIEPKLAQAAFHLVCDRIVPDRVNEDDPVGSIHRPGGIFLLADEIEIVEHLHRLDVPSGTLRIGARAAGGRTRRGLLAKALV
jgi:hypothetical protein